MNLFRLSTVVLLAALARSRDHDFLEFLRCRGFRSGFGVDGE